MQRTSNLTKLLDLLNSEHSYSENIAYWGSQPAHTEAGFPFPKILNETYIRFLSEKGFHNLYSHQAEALRAINSGQNVVITTGTASGKSLCYQVPLIDQIMKNGVSTGLLLFPTKALAADQVNAISDLIPPEYRPIISPAIYDGDTPQRERQAIRARSKIILSNPDMLNLGILPNHTKWASFFQNLKFVVLDEVHIYRGVFGSHVANVIRRLSRICHFYGSSPLFVLTSATILNAREHAESLIEQSVTLIDEDGAPKGEKHFLVYNPPLTIPELGIREGLQTTTLKFITSLYSQRIQTLVFCRTRRFVELLLREARFVIRQYDETIRGYRSGYLRSERREIEEGLKSGEVLCGIATN